MGNYQQQEDGLAGQLGLDGDCVSSTRAELVGIIGLAVGPMPINCGVDNLTAVRNTNGIINWRLQYGSEVALPRPLALRPNGDLLAILDAIICARGPTLLPSPRSEATQT